MPFADMLRAQMGRPPGYSPGLVSRLSGVPKATIVNWLQGRVARPRRWQDVVRLADAMRLGRTDTDDLLASANQPSLAEISRCVTEQDRSLLEFWTTSGSNTLSVSSPLPAVTTPFLGRASERTAVIDLVSDPDVRVITLTGVGGVGKTRLALEVASAIAERFRDGVAWVGLAPLTEAELVPEFIAQALGVAERNGGMLASLASRHQLVVLDNFEHVMSALPAVAELLAGAAGLTFLVTSRAVLHLYGEHQFEVAPLPVPDADEARLDAVAENPAVALFTQRARAVDPSFRLEAANAGVIIEICRRLDGLPLAIELAAARTTVLGPEGLLARLASRLGLLNWGSRDLPARHQSLYATLEWSLAQLDDSTRRLFANLSVFMSGCRLDGAQAVGTPLAPDEVLDALMALVDHSLVRTLTINDETRFYMLETVRSYASLLLTPEESDQLHELALQYVVEVADTVHREAQGPRGKAWLDRAEEELDNIRALLRWSFDHDDPMSAAMIAASLLPLWLRHNQLLEGQRWLDLAVAHASRLSPGVLANTLHAADRLARHRSDIATARPSLFVLGVTDIEPENLSVAVSTSRNT